jgi:hypothetical protein
LADLFGAEDGNIVAGKGAAGHCSGLPGPPGDTDLPGQIGDLLIERTVFGAAESTKTLVNPNRARAWCSPKIAAS